MSDSAGICMNLKSDGHHSTSKGNHMNQKACGYANVIHSQKSPCNAPMEARRQREVGDVDCDVGSKTCPHVKRGTCNETSLRCVQFCLFDKTQAVSIEEIEFGRYTLRQGDNPLQVTNSRGPRMAVRLSFSSNRASVITMRGLRNTWKMSPTWISLSQSPVLVIRGRNRSFDLLQM